MSTPLLKKWVAIGFACWIDSGVNVFWVQSRCLIRLSRSKSSRCRRFERIGICGDFETGKSYVSVERQSAYSVS